MSALPETTTLRWVPPCDGTCNKVHRPYSKQRKLTSVTTLVDKIAKPGLVWGAAKETAIFAVDHPSEWRGLSRDEAIERLRTHYRGVWDSSADVGTLVHSVNEHWIDGEEWNAEHVDRQQLHCKDDDFKFGQLVRRMPPYVAGLAKFWQQCDPQTIATEVVLRHTGLGILGTGDWICTLPPVSGDDVWLIDAKTTSELDPDKGLYLDSWRPQLAMYQRAAEVVHYHGYDEVGAWPLEDCFPRPTRCGILHLRGDNEFQLIEVDTDAEILDELIAALRVMHRWSLKAGQGTPAPVVVAESKTVYPERPRAVVDPAVMFGE